MTERDTPTYPLPERGLRTAGASLAVVLLAAALPHAALAAGWGLACDRSARDLKSAEIPIEALTASGVDHMTDPADADPAVVDATDATAPLLFLTPRVVHILEDIFGERDTVAVSPAERVRRVMVAASAARQPGEVSAEAASDGTPDAAEDRGNDAAADPESAILAGPMTETLYDVDTLPRFQRQMFRNDI